MARFVNSTATIAAGESLSSVIACSTGAPVFIFIPPQWTSALVSFQVSPDGNVFYDVFDSSGEELVFRIPAGSCVGIPAIWDAVLYMRVRSGSHDNLVPQELCTGDYHYDRHGGAALMLGPLELGVVVNLIGSVTPRVVIEFGVNLGKTARAVLDATPSVETYIGIDLPDDLRPRLRGQHAEMPLYPGLDALDDPRFKLLLRDSVALTEDELEPIDAAFIDGDHSAVAVVHDSQLARKLVRPGGIIVWHDYTNTTVEVTEVIDRLISEGWPIHHVPNTWVVYMRV